MLELFTTDLLAFIGPIGWTEGLVLLLLGVLIFGKRLPEVGKSLGRSIVEFKKGLSGLEDEIKTPAAHPPVPRSTSKIESAAQDEAPGGSLQQPQTAERSEA